MSDEPQATAWVTELARRGEAEFDALIASVPDAVYLGDFTGIKRANRIALDMLGFETVEELNKNIPTLADRILNRDPATGRRLRTEEEAFVRALGGETCVVEVLCRHLKTGEDIIVRCAAAPVRIDGKIVGAIAINTDITAQKAAEAALRTDVVAKRLVRRLLRDLADDRDASLVARRRLGASLAADAPHTDLAAELRFFNTLGIGELRLVESKEGRYSIEGRALLERTPGHGRTTCHVALGFLEAAIAQTDGGASLGAETQCESTGHARCQFVVRARAAARAATASAQ